MRNMTKTQKLARRKRVNRGKTRRGDNRPRGGEYKPQPGPATDSAKGFFEGLRV